MNAIKRIVAIPLFIALVGVTGIAQYRQSTPGNYQSVRQLVLRIQNRTELFRESFQLAIERNNTTTRQEENIASYTDDFETALRDFRQRLDERTATASDAQRALNAASLIDRFMRRQSLDARTQAYWTRVRVDLDQLRSIYGLSWQDTTPTRTWPAYSTNLTGTYRLDSARSDNPRIAADRVMRSIPSSSQERMDQITARLESPDQIAIEQHGSSITFASTRAQQVTIEADGRERVETSPDGRTMRTFAVLNGDQLTINHSGDRDRQFEVTFTPLNYGRELRVTKRISFQNSYSPVVLNSVYTRIADVARFDIYTGPGDYRRGDNAGFILRNGDTVVAELIDPLSTRYSRNGSSFTARVRLPTDYAGAVLEGHVSNVERSGRITGRSVLTLNFDRIRLRDGRSYQFAGIVDGVTLPNGETARVDNEGAVRDENQSDKTLQRTAIGTAIGAVIGAIAGGGKGAAIGAVIGAGTGAGSVYVQGRDDLDLPSGTEINIRATGPNRY